MSPSRAEAYLKKVYKQEAGHSYVQPPMKWNVAQRSPVRPLRFKKPTPMKIKELTPKLKQD